MSDIEFLRADEYAKNQLPQLRNSRIVSVWIDMQSGSTYKVEYSSSQYTSIIVVISYD